MAFTRHVSLSSRPSSKLVCVVWFSAGTQSRTLPSSPALASISPASVSRAARVQGWHTNTSWTPSYYVDGLRVLYERREVSDLALFPMRLDVPELFHLSAEAHGPCLLPPTHPDVVVSASSCQASFAVWLKVSRVDWGVFVVPGDQKRSCLHCG